MASIRRTLSPVNHERSSSHQNGLNPSPLSINSPSHKLPATFLAGVWPEKTSRRGLHKPWKRPFNRLLLFFFVGFLLGILPLGYNDRAQDLVFEIKPQVGNEKIVSKLEDFGVKLDVVLGNKFDYQPRKLLIVVTPTSNRGVQGYYLHRLSQVLKLLNPPVLWVVVEMNVQSSETAEILRNTGVMYRHLVCRKNLTDVNHWNVHQRNTALEHIEVHRLDGIVYFADDYNVYSLELFESIRDISHFGTWPVAMLAHNKNKVILEGPVCNRSQVIGWHTNDKSKILRRFHTVMSGFAFNSTILWDQQRWKRPFLDPIRQLDTVKKGFQETAFIEQFIAEESQMNGIPDNCEKIMNWNLLLDAHGSAYPRGWHLQQNLDVVLPVN